MEENERLFSQHDKQSIPEFGDLTEAEQKGPESTRPVPERSYITVRIHDPVLRNSLEQNFPCEGRTEKAENSKEEIPELKSESELERFLALHPFLNPEDQEDVEDRNNKNIILHGFRVLFRYFIAEGILVDNREKRSHPEIFHHL